MKTTLKNLFIIVLSFTSSAFAQDKLGEYVIAKSDRDVAERLFTVVGTILGNMRTETNRDGSAKSEAQRKASLARANFITTHYLVSPDHPAHWDKLTAAVGDELITSYGFKKNIDTVVAAHVSEAFTASRQAKQFGVAASDENSTQDLFAGITLTDELCEQIISRLATGVAAQRERLVSTTEQWRIDRGASYVSAYLDLKKTEESAAYLQKFKEENGLK